MATLPITVGTKVLEALGLPIKGCASVTITIKPDNLVTATAEYYLEEGEIMDTVAILRELVPKES